MFSALDTAHALRQSLLGFLSSSLPLSYRADQRALGEEFHARLSRDQFRGPYVEVQPAYGAGSPLGQLCSARRGSGLARLMPPAAALTRREFTGPAAAAFARVADDDWTNPAAAVWMRPLYPHQERAFGLVLGGKSCVVATGTGSGKTECYLYPLLELLTSEPPTERQRPGVRAILLFPMNALVEDQMRRLRGLLLPLNAAASGVLARPITFGRYTGETPRDAADARRPKPEEHIAELGELLTRQEMFNAPPDILVTNFSMLEYALLRPTDHRLFNPSEQFRLLVLDEVHTYSGTVGAEVAMLLRRLRATLAPAKQPMFVGTSATLGSRPEDLEAMARFASDLFGQVVPRERVVTAPQPEASAPPVVDGLERMADEISALSTGPLMRLVAGRLDVDEQPSGWHARMAEDLERLALASDGCWAGMEADIWNEGAWSEDPEKHARELLGGIFGHSDAFRRLAALASGEAGCQDVAALTSKFFGVDQDGVDNRHLMAVEVLLAAAANATVGHHPALPVRFHYFIGEQTDAYLCVNPECPGRGERTDPWWSRLFLSHHTRCPSCNGYAFRLLLCRKCGFVVLEGWRLPGRAVITPESEAGSGAGRLLFRPLTKESRADLDGASLRRLCSKTGNWFERSDLGKEAEAVHRAGCSACVLGIAEWSPEDGKMTKCPECDQGWYQGEEVFTGPGVSPYSAATVLIEEVARRLRASNLRSQIISFSDSRQQAAKLAARLQRTNRDYVFRQLAWRTNVEAKSSISSRDLIARIFDRVDRDGRLAGLFAPSPSEQDDAGLKKSLGELLYREAVSPYRSLESIGCVAVGYPEELLARAAALRTPKCLGSDDSIKRGVLHAILDLGLRFRACVGSADNAIVADEPNLQRWKIYRGSIPPRGAPHQPDSVRLFLKNFTRRNALLNLLDRACRRARAPFDLEAFNDLIASFWETIFYSSALLTKGSSRAERSRPLIASSLDAKTGRLQLNLNCLRWCVPGGDSPLFRCEICGRVTPLNIAGVCPARDCDGALLAIAPEKLDEPGSPAAHYRELIQRNPTPLRVEEHTAEISAGRRAEIERDFRSPGDDPVDVISGSTTFELGIDIGTINAVYMANLPPRLSNYRQRAGRAGRTKGASPLIVSYVRKRPHDQYFWRDIGAFISGPVPPPRFKLSSKEILQRHGFSVILAVALKRYDAAGRPKGGLWGPKWRDLNEFLANHENLWAQAGADASSLLARVFAGVEPSLAPKLLPARIVAGLRERLERIQPLLEQRADDGVIEILGDYGVLPAYSFPIYVDELRLFNCSPRERPRRDLALTRDRRISLTEYRPGRVITAGKFQIKSLGLWEGFEERRLAHCKVCGASIAETSRGKHPCGQPTETIEALIPWGGFYGQVILDESPPELDREATVTPEAEFDPASDPPPADQPEGAAMLVAFYEANLMNLARMRQFSPGPGSNQPLRLIKRKEKDVGWPHRPHECLRLMTGDGAQKAKPYYLLHEFTTDAVRLRFVDHPASRPLLLAAPGALDKVWATISEALLAASARFLDVDDVANAELGVTFRRSPQALGRRDLVLYDTATGGAGYARTVGENLREVFKIALNIVENCECGDSCYSCLRSYRNQHLHTRLDRHLVRDGLARFTVENWLEPRRLTARLPSG